MIVNNGRTCVTAAAPLALTSSSSCRERHNWNSIRETRLVTRVQCIFNKKHALASSTQSHHATTHFFQRLCARQGRIEMNLRHMIEQKEAATMLQCSRSVAPVAAHWCARWRATGSEDPSHAACIPPQQQTVTHFTQMLRIIPHMSNFTRHTSHVTRHTSHTCNLAACTASSMRA